MRTLGIILVVVILCVVLSAIGFGLGWFGEATQVAQQEFGPAAMLKKYETFKDMAAQLDKKRADITVYESRIAQVDKGYAKLERQKWPRDDRERCIPPALRDRRADPSHLRSAARGPRHRHQHGDRPETRREVTRAPARQPSVLRKRFTKTYPQDASFIFPTNQILNETLRSSSPLPW